MQAEEANNAREEDSGKVRNQCKGEEGPQVIGAKCLPRLTISPWPHAFEVPDLLLGGPFIVQTKEADRAQESGAGEAGDQSKIELEF